MKINNKSIRTFAMFASLMMLTVIAVPMVAAQNNVEYNYCDETQLSTTTDITLYDLAGSEIEIIDGLPYIIVETEDEYVHIPFPLSNTMDMMADGVPITVEVDGNYLLIPTEDGIERVCISVFDVELVDGNLMLVHEMNPAWKAPLLLAASVAMFVIWALEVTFGMDICHRCEAFLVAGGIIAVLGWPKILKLSKMLTQNQQIDFALTGTLYAMMAARLACNNPNCLFLIGRRI